MTKITCKLKTDQLVINQKNINKVPLNMGYDNHWLERWNKVNVQYFLNQMENINKLMTDLEIK